MKNNVRNSFYEQNLKGLKVLVLAPHQDDEINIAGNTIANFVNCGADVKVCFSTNGDYTLPASVRIREAVASLKKLGCNKQNIYFLGYGDTLNGSFKSHIFYNKNDVVKSKAGYSETYGVEEISDYAYIKSGKHSKYNANNFCKDLKNIILDVVPDIIICVDLDTHADHRMLSLSFDEVMGKILRENNSYTPLILKRFAYDLAYFAIQDFYDFNIKQNKRPILNHERCIQQFIDKAYYSWNDRWRMPVIKNEYGNFVFSKKLTQALFCHRSQSAAMKALGIINSDEVFFERRSDSLSYKATVQVSSGKGAHLKDFKILNLTDIDAQYIKFDNYLWQPEADDKDKKATFIWDEKQDVRFIRIYGNLEDTGYIKSLLISFDNGFQIKTNRLPKDGLPLELEIPRQIVNSCTIQILDVEGYGYGISECEFFSTKEVKNILPAFLKITIEDNFVYKYIMSADCTKVALGIYTSNIEKEIKFSVIKGDAEINNQKLYLKKDNFAVIRAEDVSGKAYDQIVICREAKWKLITIQLLQKVEKIVFIGYCRLCRKSFFYKQNGFKKTLMSLIKKL